MKVIKGKDLLISIGGKCVAYCTSHTITYNTDTKEYQVKPPATEPVSSGLFKGKTVNGLSVSISFEGLRGYDATENGFEELSALWGKGESVDVKGFRRSQDTAPHIQGKFVIDSLEENSPADDDATYSGQLSNDGEPDIYPGKTTAKS